MTPVTSRLVLHFPGFEPVDAESHRKRYERSSRQSAAAFGFTVQTGPSSDHNPFPDFEVTGQGPNWATKTRLVIFDHNDYISSLRSPSFAIQVVKGYAAMLRVITEAGMVGYFRQAWRFALFFVFPFLLMAVLFALTAVIALLPFYLNLPVWNFIWSLPLAGLLFRFAFMPFAEKYLTLHLFADWRMAVSVARREDPRLEALVCFCFDRIKPWLAEPYDEIVVTGHSMGASLAADVLGRLLAENPEMFQGKSVVFVTLGGAILQCALLKSAKHLREKVALIAQSSDIQWMEVQCLTDIVHFYKTKTVEACGYPHLPQPKLLLVRFKKMLTREHYKKIKTDVLRVHRQYVLGSDIRSQFDFGLMTAGPIPAFAYADFAETADLPLGEDGALKP